MGWTDQKLDNGDGQLPLCLSRSSISRPQRPQQKPPLSNGSSDFLHLLQFSPSFAHENPTVWPQGKTSASLGDATARRPAGRHALTTERVATKEQPGRERHLVEFACGGCRSTTPLACVTRRFPGQTFRGGGTAYSNSPRRNHLVSPRGTSQCGGGGRQGLGTKRSPPTPQV